MIDEPGSDAKAGPGEPEREKDRRNSPRASIQLRVEYRQMNAFFADYTKNVSHGGTFIRTTEPLPMGTVCLFRLIVPRLADPIALQGEVVWVKRAGGPSPPGVPEDHEPGMGIRFMYDSPEQRAAISETVEQLMVESLGSHLYNKLMGRGT